MQRRELSKKQILVISLISLIVLTLLIGADLYLKAGKPKLPPMTQPVTQQHTEPGEAPDYHYATINSALSLVTEEVYEPGPTELNLAYFYPDGVAEDDVINSYAGQIYKELSTLEAKYLASFYDLSDASPMDMAKRLNRPISSVIGKYDPNDPSQDPNDPSSWIIDNFKNVNVSFYDGDGNRINGYSAVQEIMSMASVYSYYHDMYDAEAMKQYALSLFDSFRHDSIRLGDVYYCNGCLNMTIEEEALEAIEQEQAQATETVTYMATAETQSNPDNVFIPGQIYVQGSIADTEAVLSDEEYRRRNGGIPSGIETMPQTVAGNETHTGAAESAAIPEVTAMSEAAMPEAAFLHESTNMHEATAVPEAATEAETVASIDPAKPADQAETLAPRAARVPAHKCPGHIDIFVNIRMKGMDDVKSIFEADKLGNDPANFNDSWQGWTEDKIAQAKLLNSYNWIEKYGLTLSAISGGEALSEEEIESYMESLPADLSSERRAVVEFALNSVGKVPYYWGGKPLTRGYDGNDFSMLTKPDYRGRVLRGLDCSGWVNWVYWSALSKPLKGESTGTLIGLGKRIKRTELKPGDIIVRTGADAHVVMFLEWTSDGKMLAVHETGGVINNVIISEMTANWPYYRSLLD